MRRPCMQVFVSMTMVLLILITATGCVITVAPTPNPGTDIPAPVETVIPNTATAGKPDDPAASVTPPPTSTLITKPTHTFSPEPSRTPLPYALQAGSPAYIGNFAHPQDGCNWMGAAGQVFGETGDPQANLVVVVKGWYGGKKIEAIGVTGTVAGDIYGPGGYEVVIGNQLQATQGQLTIQVFDLAGNPLTRAIKFDTFDSCEKNLIIINFST